MSMSYVLICLVLVGALDSVSGYFFERVQDKLERFATNANAETSDLNRTELMGMLKEYDEKPQYWQNELKYGPVERRQLLHLVVMPALRVRQVLSKNSNSFALFKANIEKNYKLFRPAYHSDLVGDGKMHHQHPKVLNLSNKLKGDANSLTIADFEAAKSEAQLWQARLLELVEHEDIHTGANKIEFKSILNMLNNKTYRPLFTDILPNLEANSEPKELAKRYFELMDSMYGWKWEDGRWVVYSRRGAQ